MHSIIIPPHCPLYSSDIFHNNTILKSGKLIVNENILREIFYVKYFLFASIQAYLSILI